MRAGGIYVRCVKFLSTCRYTSGGLKKEAVIKSLLLNLISILFFLFSWNGISFLFSLFISFAYSNKSQGDFIPLFKDRECRRAASWQSGAERSIELFISVRTVRIESECIQIWMIHCSVKIQVDKYQDERPNRALCIYFTKFWLISSILIPVQRMPNWKNLKKDILSLSPLAACLDPHELVWPQPHVYIPTKSHNQTSPTHLLT